MSSTGPAVNGFTFFELLFVVVLCAVIATLGLPAFNSLLARARLHRSAETIAADLRLAHHLAVTSRIPIYVSFSTAAQCYSVSGEPDCPCDTSRAACLQESRLRSYAKVIDRRQLGGVQISEARFGAASGTMFSPPRGTARFGHIILTDRGRLQLQLRLSLPGRVRICNPDAATTYSDYPPC